MEKLNNIIMHFKNINDELTKKAVEIENNLVNSYVAIDGTVNLTKDKVKKLAPYVKNLFLKQNQTFRMKF